VIRTLVVDDDYHVAHAHALSVGRVPGFSVVGEAHSAEEARQLINDQRPDLLLLDMYLPDHDGLELVRRLTSESAESDQPGHVPDFLLVTAARDIESVRSAMQLGAIYYLVKPFTFAALREQLESYRQWRRRLEQSSEADQGTVDALYGLLRSPAVASATRRNLPPTMARVLDIVQASATPLGAAEVAVRLGVSRPTAQRYLAALVQKQAIDLDLAYGTTGRPEHRYLARSRRQ
jgi:response regulator of citrate/malate metabolism